MQEWINRNGDLIGHLCDALLVGTELSQEPSRRSHAVGWISSELVSAVTAAAEDESLVQDALSERLANRGILPMFGFPTRARNLYHKYPKQWPPRHVVDRDLELAISMFAPGAETVKEGAIHTAIGVGHYRPGGRNVVEGPAPLGPPVVVGLCSNCEHVETETPHRPACPVCGTTSTQERSYRPVDLRQPKGFITYFRKARDYDGAFEFTPRAARPKLGHPTFPLATRLNFDIGSGTSRLHVVNDNAGRLFAFSRQGWAGTEALVDVDAANAADRRHAASVRRQPSAPLTAIDPVRCALAAVSETDSMLVGIHDYGPGQHADPSTLEGRAALYSLAFLLRRAAAVYLDIQDYELKAGIRTQPSPSPGSIAGHIFLSDTLENGAGYATHLGSPAVTRQLFEMITRPSWREFHERLVDDRHANACATSCPDCMRSYSNLAYHSLLDWRLAVDMADLALDRAARPSLSSSRWLRVTELAVSTLKAGRPHHAPDTFGGLRAVSDATEAIVLIHPLWRTDNHDPHPQVAAAVDEAAKRGLTCRFTSVFEALRRPA